MESGSEVKPARTMDSWRKLTQRADEEDRRTKEMSEEEEIFERMMEKIFINIAWIKCIV